LRRVTTTRRTFFRLAGGFAMAIVAGHVCATPEAMREAIGRITRGAALRDGRVSIDIPPLVENGNSVGLTVNVDSPMTDADYVKAIHVITEKNPLPNVISVHLGPRSGRATVTTRIRLADTQTVTAVAELNDGSFWSGSADIVVTLAACLEEVR
jgi:sulfur-oxidizing protein SoxY